MAAAAAAPAPVPPAAGDFRPAARARVRIQPRDRMTYGVTGGNPVMRMLINDTLRDAPQENPKLEVDMQFARSYISTHLNMLPPENADDALIGLFVAYCMPSEVVMERMRTIRARFIEHGSVQSIQSIASRKKGGDPRPVEKPVEKPSPPPDRRRRRRKGERYVERDSSSSEEDDGAVRDASDPAALRYNAVAGVAKHAALLLGSPSSDIFLKSHRKGPRMLQSYSAVVICSILDNDAKALVSDMAAGGYNLERAFTAKATYMAMAIAMSYRLTTFYVSGGHTNADRLELAALRARFYNALQEINRP